MKTESHSRAHSRKRLTPGSMTRMLHSSSSTAAAAATALQLVTRHYRHGWHHLYRNAAVSIGTGLLRLAIPGHAKPCVSPMFC
jgi:hypothetical protein